MYFTDGPPPGCTFSANDWHILASYWHPVALSEEVGAEHLSTTLLDVDVVLYRSSRGALTAANNQCPHRGASLARGWVEDGQMVCAYHGFAYDADGACVRIPAVGAQAKIPAKLCLKTYQVAEKYGLIWVCLKDEAVQPIPDFDAWSDPNNQTAALSARWNASAGRHAENFGDVAHAAWIHAETFAPRDYPEIGRFDVEETEHGLYYEVEATFLAANTFEAKKNQDIETSLSQYFFTMPFTFDLKMNYQQGTEHIFDTVQPMSACKIRLFMLKTRDFMKDEPIEDWIEFQEAVNEEDRGTVEDQWPQDLPLNLADEFHMAADAFSIAYRRKLKDLGLQGSATLSSEVG